MEQRQGLAVDGKAPAKRPEGEHWEAFKNAMIIIEAQFPEQLQVLLGKKGQGSLTGDAGLVVKQFKRDIWGACKACAPNIIIQAATWFVDNTKSFKVGKNGDNFLHMWKAAINEALARDAVDNGFRIRVKQEQADVPFDQTPMGMSKTKRERMQYDIEQVLKMTKGQMASLPAEWCTGLRSRQLTRDPKDKTRFLWRPLTRLELVEVSIEENKIPGQLRAELAELTMAQAKEHYQEWADKYFSWFNPDYDPGEEAHQRRVLEQAQAVLVGPRRGTPDEVLAFTD